MFKRMAIAFYTKDFIYMLLLQTWPGHGGSNHRENQGKRCLAINLFEISLSLLHIPIAL